MAFIVAVDAIGGIGEPQRAVGFDDHVIWRVEPLAVEPVDHGRPAAVMAETRNPAIAVLASNHPPLMVERVAILEPARGLEDADRPIGLVIAKHPVVRDVRPEERLGGRHVDGPSAQRHPVHNRSTRALTMTSLWNRRSTTSKSLISPPSGPLSRAVTRWPSLDARPRSRSFPCRRRSIRNGGRSHGSGRGR